MKDFNKSVKRKAPRGSRKRRPLRLDMKKIAGKAIRLTLGAGIAALAFFAFTFCRTYMTSAPFFALSEIVVEGNHKVDREAILKSAGIGEGTNIFSMDMETVGRNMEAMPWVKHVVLERDFPHRLKIRIEERRPLALVNLERLYYVDEESNIFAEADEKTGLDFPVVAGLDRDSLVKGQRDAFKRLDKALDFLKAMRGREGVFSWGSISELIVDKKGAITLYAMGSGIPVYLGKDGYESRLRRAEKTLTDLQQKGIKARLIDADFKDKVVVRKAI